MRSNKPLWCKIKIKAMSLTSTCLPRNSTSLSRQRGTMCVRLCQSKEWHWVAQENQLNMGGRTDNSPSEARHEDHGDCGARRAENTTSHDSFTGGSSGDDYWQGGYLIWHLLRVQVRRDEKMFIFTIILIHRPKDHIPRCTIIHTLLKEATLSFNVTKWVGGGLSCLPGLIPCPVCVCPETRHVTGGEILFVFISPDTQMLSLFPFGWVRNMGSTYRWATTKETEERRQFSFGCPVCNWWWISYELWHIDEDDNSRWWCDFRRSVEKGAPKQSKGLT